MNSSKCSLCSRKIFWGFWWKLVMNSLYDMNLCSFTIWNVFGDLSEERINLVFIQNEEDPKCWWETQLLILFIKNFILRQSFIHEESAGVWILWMCFTPKVLLGIAIISLGIFLLNHFDWVFFANVHEVNFSGQRVDDPNTTFDASNFSDNITFISPPEISFIGFFFKNRRENWNTFDVLVDSVQWNTILVECPIQIFASKLNQQSKILKSRAKFLSLIR